MYKRSMKYTLTGLLTAFYLIVSAVQSQALGNPDYTPHTLRFSSSFEGGKFGSKDYIYEDVSFGYTFPGVTRHKFTLRVSESVLLPGLISGNLQRTGPLYAVSSGFEYTYRFISPEYGVTLFLETGFGPGTFYFATLAGLGNVYSNGFFLTVKYLHSYYLQNDFDVYFQILSYLSLRANASLFFDLTDTEPEGYLKTGIFPGFQYSEYFRINAGGGFTVSESFIFGFYFSLYLSTVLPVR